MINVITSSTKPGLGCVVALHFPHPGVKTPNLTTHAPSQGEVRRFELLADPIVKQQIPKTDIQVTQLDPARYNKTIAFANKVQKEVALLDLLVFNAGNAPFGYGTSASRTRDRPACQFPFNNAPRYLAPTCAPEKRRSGRLPDSNSEGR